MCGCSQYLLEEGDLVLQSILLQWLQYALEVIDVDHKQLCSLCTTARSSSLTVTLHGEGTCLSRERAVSSLARIFLKLSKPAVRTKLRGGQPGLRDAVWQMHLLMIQCTKFGCHDVHAFGHAGCCYVPNLHEGKLPK